MAYDVWALNGNGVNKRGQRLFDWSQPIEKRYINMDYYDGYHYYFNDTVPQMELHHYSDGTSNMDWIIAAKPDDDLRISKYFSFLKQIRCKREEVKVDDEINSIVKEGELQSFDNPTIDVSLIKNNPERLKQYIEHLINLETSIYSLKERLNELFKRQIPINEDVIAVGYQAAEEKRELTQTRAASSWSSTSSMISRSNLSRSGRTF